MNSCFTTMSLYKHKHRSHAGEAAGIAMKQLAGSYMHQYVVIVANLLPP